MNEKETVAMLKEIMFERVMLGEDILLVVGRLHFEEGYSKEIILKVLDEMKEEAGL
jgi:hypothetical protein